MNVFVASVLNCFIKLFINILFVLGRSPSKMSLVSVNEDAYEQEEDYFNGIPPRPSRTPSATSRETRLRIPETIDEGHSATRRQYNLNLGKGTTFGCYYLLYNQRSSTILNKTFVVFAFRSNAGDQSFSDSNFRRCQQLPQFCSSATCNTTTTAGPRGLRLQQRL